MKKSKNSYSTAKYLKELFFYYIKTIPSFLILVFLICLFVVLFITLNWGNDPIKQNIVVIISLQIAYATLASILFYIITFLIPQQTKKLKFSYLIKNSSAHILSDISTLFKTFAKSDELKNISNDFYKLENLKRLVEEVDGSKPINLTNTVLIFPNSYELILFIISKIEEKTNRLMNLNDVLSVDAMDTLSSILGMCLNIKSICQLTRHSDFKFLSFNLCELYMVINNFSNQINADFSFRLLYHYMNIKKRNTIESREFQKLFF